METDTTYQTLRKVRGPKGVFERAESKKESERVVFLCTYFDLNFIQPKVLHKA